MALISRIRKRVGLLIGFVGVSMLLFILGDVLTSSSGLFHRNSDVIGEIDGTKVHYQEFERKVDNLIETYKTNSKSENVDPGTQDMLREQAWGTYINDNVLGKEYENLGISCSAEELYDMCTGKNPHQEVRKAFSDPKTGMFDPNVVVRFLKDLPNREEAVQRQWRTFEDAIKEERISEKYKNVIKYGMIVTTEEAKRSYSESHRTASIRFVRLDYNTIPDNSVKIEESDLSSYYKENKEKYKQTETMRRAEYITFDVSPSSEDRESVMNWINSKKNDFTQSTDDKLFINQNSDTPFDSTFHAKGSLKADVDTVLFESPVGTMIGPMEDAGSFKIWKLLAENMVSDSVKARHILIKIENNDTAKAMSKADSLRNAIKKGSKFDDLAKMFSADQGSAIKGGDLGWFRQGAMVPSFNDACFKGKKGDLPIVTSQFGVHLIEILDKGSATKQIQVAVLERKIEPSQKTYDMAYNKAIEFASKNTTVESFDSSIVKQGLNKRIADNVRENDKNIPGLDQPREMVRWIYSAKVGDLSKVFTFGDKYVIAHLTDIRDKGILPLDIVRPQVMTEVRKQKKAEMLMDKFSKANAPTIDGIAQKLNLTATDAENVIMVNPYITGIGNEPNVVGTIFALKANQMSKPIKGETGVTQFFVKSINEITGNADYSANMKQVASQRISQSEFEVFNALKEKANIEDNRGKFY